MAIAAGSTGSTSSGPSLRTLFTRSLTGSSRSSISSVGSRMAWSSAGIGKRGIEPQVPRPVRHDDRHPVVQLGHLGVGCARHDREGPDDPIGRGVAPARPESGEDERPSIRATDRVRLSPGADSLPLVEPVDRDEAALSSERVRERRRPAERLCPRVEHPGGGLWTVRPVRDQAPSVRDDRPPLLALGDDIGRVRRGDVEPRPGARRRAVPRRRSRPAPTPGAAG